MRTGRLQKLFPLDLHRAHEFCYICKGILRWNSKFKSVVQRIILRIFHLYYSCFSLRQSRAVVQFNMCLEKEENGRLRYKTKSIAYNSITKPLSPQKSDKPLLIYFIHHSLLQSHGGSCYPLTMPGKPKGICTHYFLLPGPFFLHLSTWFPPTAQMLPSQ